MTARRSQSGMTLVVALVMLIVLTLLVVSAIRFANINLRIAGNVQTETEAVSAAQVAVESTVKDIISSPNMSTIATATKSVSTGGQTYQVVVTKPTCIFNKPINNSDLDPTRAADQVCFGAADPDLPTGPDGKPVSAPTSCKDQQWDVTASVDDNGTGAKVTVLQGVAVRVGAEVTCP